MQGKVRIAVIGVVLGVAAILALMPKVVGLGVRDNTISSLLELIPPETRSQLNISESSFDSGWFTSSAIVDVRYAPFGSEALTLQLEFEISHGPILFTSDGIELGLAHAEIRPQFDNEELSQALLDMPFEIPTIRLDLLAGFDQSLQLGLDVSPVNYSDNQAEVIFEGMNGSFIANADQSAEFLLSMGKLQAQESTSSFGFTLGGLEFVSATDQVNDLLAPSNALLDIFLLSSDAPYPFVVNEIVADSRIGISATDPEMIDIFQRFDIASIESEFPLASMSWTSEINELHSDLIRSYYVLLADLQNQMSGNAGAASPQINQISQDLGLRFIQNSLVFNNLIEANAYDGDHSVDLRIDWDGLPQLDNLANLDFNEVAAALNIQLDVSMDHKALMRSPAAEFINPYIKQGYLILDNGRILIDATLSNSELVVNGEPIPLDQFF